ncbi:Iron-sulfur assembly protein 1 [Maublancomyces gigas]|uniref:Iron-sulfur assembly protein 1 n=1 Tax=Discina gigas TaxID=1032678 RepID=A0ABR3GBJ9_9PEZI
MSLHRLFLPVSPPLRILASACSAHIFRASYSSTGSSRRSLQTATSTITTTTSSLPTEPPPPRGAGILNSLTNPSNETQRSGLPPSPPLKPAAATTRTKLRARKAAITLTALAVQQLQSLLAQPDPKLIRVGVKNRGCSGLAYSLEYVDRADKFDEEVVQGGVKVLIDSKALFSIIGSEMDWVEDKLSARFVFRNPNIKEQCGCGESFSVG